MLKKNRFAIYQGLLALLFVLCACEERMPLELTSEQLPTDLGVLSLQPAIETGQAKSVVDTTGVLNSEESNYYATVLISGVKYDIGSSRQTISYSKAVFSDKNKTIEYRGKKIGFFGIDVGKVHLNGIEMVKERKLIRLPDLLSLTPRDTVAGSLYVLANRNGRDAKEFLFRHNSPSEWRVGGNPPLIRPFNISVQTPDEITVTTPRSNSVIRKNENLRVQWTGKAKSLRIVISGVKGSGLEPYLLINIKGDSGKIEIPDKVLGLLPTDTVQTYIFSFINSNRSEVRLDEFADEILVVASSVHNIVLTIQ